jgi:general secretion pathway protein I
MKMRKNLTKKRNQSGFSLLEVLIAFAIMAISVTLLLRLFSGSSRVVSVAEDYSHAILIAESLIEEEGTGARLQPGRREGQAGDRYHWTLSMTPYPITPDLLGSSMQAAAPTPYWVIAEVQWGEGSEKRAFSLRTLRLLGQAQRQ